MSASGIQNFIDTLSVGVNRAVQFAGETLGKTSRTEYDEELMSLFNDADALKRLCDKLQSGIAVWINPNPADRVQGIVMDKFDVSKRTTKLTNSEVLGQLKQNLATELPGTDLSLVLSQYGLADVEVGQAERILQDSIQKNLLANIKNFTETIWPNVSGHQQKLLSVRLDYDSAVAKRAKCTDGSKQLALDQDVRTKKEKFDAEVAAARKTLKEIKSVQDVIKDGLREMATAQMRFYTTALQHLRQLSEKFEQK